MKRFSEKLWKYLGGVQGLLLALYLFVVFGSGFASTYEISVLKKFEEGIADAKLIIIRYLFVSLILAFIVSPLLLKGMDYLSEKQSLMKNTKADIKRKALFFIIPFAVLLLTYIIYFPGSFDGDSIYQYNQALTNKYNDWHPVIHTLLAIKLPLLIGFKNVGAPVLVQIIFFSLAIGYAVSTFAEYTSKKAAFIYLLFIVLNPSARNLFMSPEKDCAFAILALLLITFGVQIYFTSGQWLKAVPNTVALIVILALATLIRHNALLFTVPYIIALFFLVSKKKAALVTLFAVVIIVAIKLPLYGALNVENPDRRQAEISGLPMTVIGAAVADNPTALDEETREFAYKVAPAETWKNHYAYGSFNSVKYEGADNTVIEEYGAAKIFVMMLKAIKASPYTTVKALVKLTEGVYSLSGDYITYRDPAHLWSTVIEIKGIPPLQKPNLAVTKAETALFPHLFMYVGAMNLLLIAALLTVWRKKEKGAFKKILLIFPVLIYNYATMLLLSDIADTARFFFYTFPVTPLLLLAALKKQNKNETDGE